MTNGGTGPLAAVPTGIQAIVSLRGTAKDSSMPGGMGVSFLACAWLSVSRSSAAPASPSSARRCSTRSRVVRLSDSASAALGRPTTTRRGAST